MDQFPFVVVPDGHFLNENLLKNITYRQKEILIGANSDGGSVYALYSFLPKQQCLPQQESLRVVCSYGQFSIF